MTVQIGPTTPHLSVDGQDYWFCCTGCRDRYAEVANVPKERAHAHAGESGG